MVAWVMLATGQTGHGMCVMDKAEAEMWAQIGNEVFEGEFKHWVEPCGEDL